MGKSTDSFDGRRNDMVVVFANKWTSEYKSIGSCQGAALECKQSKQFTAYFLELLLYQLHTFVDIACGSDLNYRCILFSDTSKK